MLEAGPPRGGGGGGRGGYCPRGPSLNMGPGPIHESYIFPSCMVFYIIYMFISTAPIPMGTINFMGPGRTM